MIPIPTLGITFDADLLTNAAREMLRLMGLPDGATTLAVRRAGQAPSVSVVSLISRADRIRKFGYEGEVMTREQLEARVRREIKVFESDTRFEKKQWLLPTRGVSKAHNSPPDASRWLNGQADDFRQWCEKGFYAPTPEGAKHD